MAMPELVERYWTAEDLRALPEDGMRYECIDGALLVTPSPRPVHQRAVVEILCQVRPFVAANRLGECMSSPADVELVPGALLQPDLFVARSHDGSRIRDWREIAGLVLAIEVLSPSSARTDRGVKRAIYQRARVDEYWIVDLDARLIERWRPQDRSPEIVHETLRWHPDGASEPMTLDLPALFAAVLDD